MLNRIDLARVDLNLLVLFAVVLKERHVARAAARLHLSPSAVSHGLRRLRRLFDDPLFLRTPRGVAPSARALELAEPIADVLARAERVVSGTGRFAAGTSTRRFIIGAPDGVSAAFLPALLATLRRTAPSVDIGVRELLPSMHSRSGGDSFWTPALSELDARAMDIAVLPLDRVPARFIAKTLYEDEFVIAMRAGHPFARKPTLDAFCAALHLMVSLSADAFSFVDEALAKKNRSRRVVLTVPNFMTALAMIAQTDLIAAVSRRFAVTHAKRFGLTTVAPPVSLPRFRTSVIAPRLALLDEGVSWLVDALTEAAK